MPANSLEMMALKGDGAQMIVLAALVVCICLLTLAMLVQSVRQAEAIHLDSGSAMDNALWAQDKGLVQAALMDGNVTWEERRQAADEFKAQARLLGDSLSKDLLERGIACQFSLNEALAARQAAGSGGEYESVDGVLLRNAGGRAQICGYSYDVLMADKRAERRACGVKIWL